MPYPRKLLNPGEEVVLDLNPHWIFFAQPVFASAGALVAWIVCLALGWPSWLAWVAFAVLVACLAWCGIRYWKWKTTNFVVTTSRLIYRTGTFAKSGVEIPLERIANVNFHQRSYERLVGAGDLTIESAGRDSQSKFFDIRKPYAVQNLIHAQMDAAEDHRAVRGQQAYAATVQPPAPSSPDVLAQLDKLDDLRKRGVLNDDEFAVQKAKLLDKM